MTNLSTVGWSRSLAVAWLAWLIWSPVLAQPPSGKQLDVSSGYVGAVILSDAEGAFLLNASCVALHPKVVLTVAHAAPGFAAQTYLANHTNQVGLTLSFAPNFRIDGQHIEVKEGQLEIHPGFGGGNRSEDEVDLALIFLDQPLSLEIFPELPVPGLVEQLGAGTILRVTGYGMHEPANPEQPFIPLQSDGNRRSSEGKIVRAANTGWFELEGHALTGDSGSPSVLTSADALTVLGLVSQAGRKGHSWITRLDNEAVLEWIRATALAEIGVTL